MTLNRTELAFVVALLLLGAGLRLIGVENGAPDLNDFPTVAARGMVPYDLPIQPDEYVEVARPYQMLVSRHPNPQYFENPSFLINLNFFTILLTGEGKGMTVAGWKGIDEREHAPFRFYVIGRTYSALFGLLAVAAIYALTRRIAGRKAALFAGLLVAVAEPLVQHAHYATPSSLAGGFASVAIWAAVLSLYRPRWALFALAGIAAGLAAGNRYNAAAVSIVVFVAGLIWLCRDRRRWRTVLLGWFLFPATFVFTTPLIIFDTAKVLQDFRFVLNQYVSGVGIDVTTPYGLFYEYRYLIIFGIGIPAALAVLVGLFAAWRTRPRHLLRENSALLVVLIIAAYIIPYSLVVLTTTRPGHSDQILVPVIPAFALVAGIGAAYLAGNRRWLTPIAALILIAFPLTLSVQLTRQFTRTDTRYLMQQWIYQHLPRGSHLQLTGSYNIPVDETWYPPTLNFFGDNTTLDQMRVNGIDYVVVSDALIHDQDRSSEIIPPEFWDRMHDYFATFDTLPLVAHIDRAKLLGDDWMMYTASVWGNPGLSVYCLTPKSCAAVH